MADCRHHRLHETTAQAWIMGATMYAIQRKESETEREIEREKEREEERARERERERERK